MNSLLHVPAAALLDVWVQLEDALSGCNSYGGFVAEIYAFQIVGGAPNVSLESVIGREMRDEYAAKAGAGLVAILDEFRARRACRVVIDDVPLSKWRRKPAFGHRVHITITPPRRAHNE